MPDSDPVLSLIVPSFNRPDLVVRASRSVLAQTDGRWELIVVDDGSTPPLRRSALDADERIRLVRNDANQGAAGARNSGIASARGEWITFLDDDDELLPEFVEETLRALKAAPDADFSWSSVRFIDTDTGEAVSERRYSVPADDAEAISKALSVGTGFGLTVRASKLRRIGGFRTDARLTEDTDLVIRLLDLGCRPTVVERVLVEIHEHAGDRMTSRRNVAVRIAETMDLLTRYREFFERYPAARTQMARHATMLRYGHAGPDFSYSRPSDEPLRTPGTAAG